MPLSSAQLTELNTLEAAVATAITALQAADPAELEQAVTNLVTAQTNLKTFTATLVADAVTPPPVVTPPASTKAPLGLFVGDEAWADIEALASELGLPAGGGPTGPRVHLYGATDSSGYKSGVAWFAGNVPAGTPLLIGTASNGVVASEATVTANCQALKAAGFTDVWYTHNFELDYSGNNQQPWGQQPMATILAEQAAVAPIIRSFGFKSVFCSSRATLSVIQPFYVAGLYDILLCDYYLDNSEGSLSDFVGWAESLSLPWGIGELGSYNEGDGPTATWITGTIAPLANGPYPSVGLNFFDLPTVGPLTAAALKAAFG